MATKAEIDFFMNSLPPPAEVATQQQSQDKLSAFEATLPPPPQGQGQVPSFGQQPQQLSPEQLQIEQQDLPQMDVQGRPFSEAPQPSQDGPIQGLARSGVRGLREGAAAVNRGITGLTDLPSAVLQAGSDAAGIPAQFPSISGSEFGQKATASSIPEEERNFVSNTLNFATEFYGGGKALNLLFKRITASKPQTLQSSTGQLVAQELAKFDPVLERAASVGAGAGTAAAEALGIQSPLVATAFGLAGGIGAAGATSRRLQGSKAELRAARAIQEKASDVNTALESIKSARPGVAGVESAEDLGIMKLYQSIIREDSGLEQNYRKYVEESNKALEVEVQDIITGGGGLGRQGDMQGFVNRNKDVMLGLIDERVAQAERRISEAKKMGGRSMNAVDQSIVFDRETASAIDDVGNQVKAVWKVADQGADIPISTEPLRGVALDVVSGFKKGQGPTPFLKKQIESLLGFKIKEGPAGWDITDVKTEKSVFKDSEPAEQIMAVRSALEQAKRNAKKGIEGSPRDVASYSRLSNAALDSLESHPGVGPTYNAAREMTRRLKEISNQGSIGASSAITPEGGVRVQPETRARTVLGGGPEQGAVGAREVDALQFARDEALTAFGAPPNPALKGATSEWFLTQFQREAKKGSQAALDWAELNRNTMQRFPEARQQVDTTIKQLKRAEGRVDDLSLQRNAIEDDAFFRVAEMGGREAVGYLLRQPNPVASTREFIRRLARSGPGKDLAVQSFKREVAEFALGAFQTNVGVASVAKAKSVIRKMEPLFKAGVYTKDERESFNRVLKELEARAKVAMEKPGDAPFEPNMFSNLAGRYIGSKILTAGAGTSSIILAGLGARTGGKIANDLSDAVVAQILSKAMTDKDLLARMLAIDLTKEGSRKGALRVIASVNAQAAQELGLLEEQDE